MAFKRQNSIKYFFPRTGDRFKFQLGDKPLFLVRNMGVLKEGRWPMRYNNPSNLNTNSFQPNVFLSGKAIT